MATRHRITLVNVGDRFGRLEVVKEAAEKGKNYRRRFVCRCECGVVKEVAQQCLLNGETQSCGCYHKQVCTTHGHAGGRRTSRLLCIYKGMLYRCHNSASRDYPKYGCRGIQVCDRWRGPNGFLRFVEDVGEPPAGTSIDRIDNDGHYQPGNVRWADRKTQQRNRRAVRLLTHDGRTQPLVAWAEELGLNPTSLHNRLTRGWPLAEALTTPAIAAARNRVT